MRSTVIATTAALLLSLSPAARAQEDAPMMFCIGFGCGGSGMRAYMYQADSGSYPMMEFRVGTNDLNPANYTQVRVPDGWNFAVEEVPISHSHGVHTTHGGIGSPCWCLTAGSCRWWTDDPAYAVEFFAFGYLHPWQPEDVGWELTTRRGGDPPDWYVFTLFWDAPVGMGHGPLHAPSSPGSLCWGNSDCGDETYCFFDTCPAETGMCAPRPPHCGNAWEPVCGCDGVTYANPCEAAKAGVNIDHFGPCDDCPGDLDGDNDVDQADLGILLAAYGVSNGGDIDGDGDTDQADLAIVLSRYGTPCD